MIRLRHTGQVQVKAKIVVTDETGQALELYDADAFDYLTNPDKSLCDFIKPCPECGKVMLTFDHAEEPCLACKTELRQKHTMSELVEMYPDMFDIV